MATVPNVPFATHCVLQHKNISRTSVKPSLHIPSSSWKNEQTTCVWFLTILSFRTPVALSPVRQMDHATNHLNASLCDEITDAGHETCSHSLLEHVVSDPVNGVLRLQYAVHHPA